jgi:hypothetical protein
MHLLEHPDKTREKVADDYSRNAYFLYTNQFLGHKYDVFVNSLGGSPSNSMANHG